MRLAYCPNPKSQVGSQFVPRYDELAYAVAAQTGFNMVNRSLKGLVERRVGSASGFKANIKLPEAAFDQCLESLYRIDPVDSPCEGDACSTRYKVKTAFRQKQGDTVGKQMILEHTFKTSGYQQNIDSTQLGSCNAQSCMRMLASCSTRPQKPFFKPSSKPRHIMKKAKLQQPCWLCPWPPATKRMRLAWVT